MEALQVLKQLMLAVELLEQEQITHRDIKLENIIYNKEAK